MSTLDVGLVAHNVVRRDGQGRVMLETARALLDRGHRVTVYTRGLDDELAAQVRHVPLRRFPGPQALDDVVLLVVGTRAVRAGGHDVVVTMGPVALPKVPFVYDSQFAQRGWRRSWTPTTRPGLYHRAHSHLAGWLETLVARRATVVRASTVQVAVDSVPRGGPPTEVVPDGIDLHEFPVASAERRQEARDALGLDAASFAVGFLGEYHTGRKGLEPLVEAVARGPADEVLVVAARGDTGSLMARAAALGCADRVNVVGFAPPGDVMAASDAIAVPSLYEPYSLVAVEAAATGTPVVVSGVAGAAALLAPGVLVVDDPSQPAQLRAGLDEVRRPDVRERLQREGRAAAERLSWAELAPLAADVVERAARLGGTGAAGG